MAPEEPLTLGSPERLRIDALIRTAAYFSKRRMHSNNSAPLRECVVGLSGNTAAASDTALTLIKCRHLRKEFAVDIGCRDSQASEWMFDLIVF